MKKILLIENDADTVYIMELAFQNTAFEVINTPEFVDIKAIINADPSIIIIDYLLDYTTGDSICSEIKTNPQTRHIPVLLYSASNNLSKIAQKCSPDAYLEKPFDLDVLEKLVFKLAL